MRNNFVEKRVLINCGFIKYFLFHLFSTFEKTFFPHTYKTHILNKTKRLSSFSYFFSLITNKNYLSFFKGE